MALKVSRSCKQFYILIASFTLSKEFEKCCFLRMRGWGGQKRQKLVNVVYEQPLIKYYLKHKGGTSVYVVFRGPLKMPTGCRVLSIFADYCDRDTFKEIFPLPLTDFTSFYSYILLYVQSLWWDCLILNCISLEVLNILKQTAYVLDLINLWSKFHLKFR